MSDKRKVSAYISVRNCALLEAEKTKTGRNYSEIIDTLLDAYFKRGAMAELNSMNAGMEEKINRIFDVVNRIQETSNATYRAANYTSHLLTNGLSKETKPNEDLKRIARKKAIRDYSSLRSGYLTKEEYLIDNETSEADEYLSTSNQASQPQQNQDNSPAVFDASKYFGVK